MTNINTYTTKSDGLAAGYVSTVGTSLRAAAPTIRANNATRGVQQRITSQVQPDARHIGRNKVGAIEGHIGCNVTRQPASRKGSSESHDPVSKREECGCLHHQRKILRLRRHIYHIGKGVQNSRPTSMVEVTAIHGSQMR